MILLAGISDTLGFGFLLAATVTIPAVGLIVSGMSLPKHGLNRWCAFASLVFFFGLLVASVMATLADRGGVGPDTLLWTMLGCSGLYVISALMALIGLVQMRQRRRKWFHGRRRGLWTFWLSVLSILLTGVWCFAHSNQMVYDRLFK